MTLICTCLLKVLNCLVVISLFFYKFKIYISCCVSLQLLILPTSFKLKNRNTSVYHNRYSAQTFSLSFFIPSNICSTCFKNRSLFFSVFIALLHCIIVQYTLIHYINVHIKILMNLGQNSKLRKKNKIKYQNTWLYLALSPRMLSDPPECYIKYKTDVFQSE